MDNVAVPTLLVEEVTHLNKVGYSITTEVQNNQVFIIFNDFELPKDIYNINKTDLLILSDIRYPKSAFDMFWVNEELKLANNAVPQAAAHVQAFLGKRWRRFSIHPYQKKAWDPSEDDLSGYLTYIHQRLKSGV